MNPRIRSPHTAEYGVFEDLVKATGRLDGTKLGRVKCKNDAEALPQADTRVRLWVKHFRGSDSEIKSLIYL